MKAVLNGSTRCLFPKGDVQESWRWLQELMGAAGQLEERAWGNLDAITAALTEAIPLF